MSRTEKIYAILAVGLYGFLFLLFFQPFGVNNYDPTERISSEFLLFMFLFGVYITIVLMANELLLFPFIFRGVVYRWQLTLWLVWTLLYASTMMFLFYNFLGNWHDFRFSSWLEFLGNISATAIIPIAVIVMYARMKQLQELTRSAQDYHTDEGQIIQFPSDNQKDQLSLALSAILFLESEDNYVSVHYLHQEQMTKTLVRTTLKKVEEMSLHPALVRCHRSYIVNIMHLTQFRGNQQQGYLTLQHVETPFPVSRKYATELAALLR